MLDEPVNGVNGVNGQNQLPSTTKDSALPDQLNNRIYMKQCGGVSLSYGYIHT